MAKQWNTQPSLPFQSAGVSTADGEAVEYTTLAACELEGDTLPFSESELSDL